MRAAVTAQFLGLRDYAEVRALQIQLRDRLINGDSSAQTLLICEHPPTITWGNLADPSHLLNPAAQVCGQPVKAIAVERGGEHTYHGPGQLVVYPIIDLRLFKQDAHWYVRSLEAVIIKMLERLGIDSFPVSGKTGVWVNNVEKPGFTEGFAGCTEKQTPAKIASIGVKLSRWCTMHGFSLNLTEEVQAGFAAIVPCGLTGVQIASVAGLTGRRYSCQELSELTAESFNEVFN